MSNLKKRITLALAGEEIDVDVNMRIIEIAERVYDLNADVIASVLLVDPGRVKLTQLADVICEWITPAQYKAFDLRRKDLREAIYSATHDELRVIIGCVQAAILFCRRHINEDELQALSRGEDLPDESEGEEETSKKSNASSGPDSAPASSE